MTVKELKDKLEGVNPSATILLRDTKDLAQANLKAVEFDPLTYKHDSDIIMFWGDFQ